LRVVVAGIAVAVIPGFFTLVYFWRLRETNQADSIFNSLPMVLVAVTLLAAPLSITYAVLRHRLFDLSFTIRKALRYTLARWVVLSLVPAISIFMILETIRLGHETVYTVLRRRGTLFLVLTLVAFVIFGNRRRWLRAIDRRFYRERHYAHALLPAIAEQVRRADSVEGVAPIVVALIEARRRCSCVIARPGATARLQPRHLQRRLRTCGTTASSSRSRKSSKNRWIRLPTPGCRSSVRYPRAIASTSGMPGSKP
jgi:hypothetical protein